MHLLQHVLNAVVMSTFPDTSVLQGECDDKLCYIRFGFVSSIPNGLEVILEEKLREFFKKKHEIDQTEMATNNLIHLFEKRKQFDGWEYCDQHPSAVLDVIRIDDYIGVLEKREDLDLDKIQCVKIISVEHNLKESKEQKRYVVDVIATAAENRSSLQGFVKRYKSYQGHEESGAFSFDPMVWLPEATELYQQVEKAIIEVYGTNGYQQVRCIAPEEVSKSLFTKKRYFCFETQQFQKKSSHWGVLDSALSKRDYTFLEFTQHQAELFLKMSLELYTIIPLDIYFILSLPDEMLEVFQQGEKKYFIDKHNSDQSVQIMGRDGLGRAWEIGRWDQKGCSFCSSIERVVALRMESKERNGS